MGVGDVIPLQVLCVGFRETAGFRDDGHCRVPEVLVGVVLHEPLVAVLGLTHVDDRLGGIFRFAEQEVHADTLELVAFRRLGQLTARDEYGLDDPRGDVG